MRVNNVDNGSFKDKKVIRLTPTAKEILRQKCRNRLNWTDGGYWNGSGKGSYKECFTSHKVKNRVSRIYKFPTDAAANKWNSIQEKNIRYAGHTGTATLTLAVGILTGGFASIGVGAILAVIKDELQAKIPYPKMERGWSFQFIMEHQDNWSPHPFIKSELTQVITLITRDHQGVEINKSEIVRVFSRSDIPEELAQLIAEKPNRESSVIYE